jgi:hypothetical protein
MTHIPQGLNNTFDHDVTILGNLIAKVPTPTSDNNIANKKYVDDNITKTNFKGHIEHGATAGTSRPTGFTSVEWVGSVEPTNAVNGDTWIDTS